MYKIVQNYSTHPSIKEIKNNIKITNSFNFVPVTVNECLHVAIEQNLNNILCGFRKAHSTQQDLFKLLQSQQQEFDQYGTILMDLPKAYNCLSYEVIIVKLEA